MSETVAYLFIEECQSHRYKFQYNLQECGHSHRLFKFRKSPLADWYRHIPGIITQELNADVYNIVFTGSTDSLALLRSLCHPGRVSVCSAAELDRDDMLRRLASQGNAQAQTLLEQLNNDAADCSADDEGDCPQSEEAVEEDESDWDLFNAESVSREALRQYIDKAAGGHSSSASPLSLYIYKLIGEEIPEGESVTRAAFEKLHAKYRLLAEFGEETVQNAGQSNALMPKCPLLSPQSAADEIHSYLSRCICSGQPCEALIYIHRIINPVSAYKYLGGLRLFDAQNDLLRNCGYDFLCLCVSPDVSDEISSNGCGMVMRCRL